MIINPHTRALRAQVEDIVKELHQFVQEIGHRELAETVGELRNRMHEPYMFVIVGEVKSGKSSFVNALLDAGREICPVAPQPMTDVIQQILYGETEETIVVNPYFKKILLPVEILKELAIVDTPGTNSIVERHQEITERFIPSSDLVVFVFEAKNPYRQSAWDFFDYIHRDWHKKIIFVLQQKDLLPPEDLKVNEQGLYDFARKKGLAEPLIFSVSAKAEQEGRYDASGFSTVRDYIRSHVTGGRGAALKLQNNLHTTVEILDRIRKDLDTRAEQFRLDTAFRADIRETLDKQETKSHAQAGVLIENLLHGYDRITKTTYRELDYALGFPSLLRRSFMAIFTKQPPVKEWLNDLAKRLETNLNAELRNKLNDGVTDLADSIQQMAKIIDLKIQTNRSVVKSDAYIFEDISNRRTAVLKDLQEDFARFLARSENFTETPLFADHPGVSPNIAAGSGIALIGVILAAVTHVAVLDITGGVLTTVGLLFASFSAGNQRRKILEGYQKEIGQGRRQMEATLQDKLRAYIRTIKGRINDNFGDWDALLSHEEQQVKWFEEKYNLLKTRLETARQNLGADLL